MNALVVFLAVVITAVTAGRDGRVGFCVPGMACSTQPFAVCECWGRLEVCCSAGTSVAKAEPRPVSQLQRVQPLKICTGWGDTCGDDDQMCVCARVPPCTCWTSAV